MTHAQTFNSTSQMLDMSYRQKVVVLLPNEDSHEKNVLRASQ